MLEVVRDRANNAIPLAARRSDVLRAALPVVLCSAAATLVFFAGCASAPRPTVVAATVRAAANVNPDVHRRPSPIVVRLYELRSAASFNAADFLSLYDKDQATLGADMVTREEFVLQPGDSKSWEQPVGADVKFIGVIGAYRNLEAARWKSVVALTPGARNVLTIAAQQSSIEASPTP